MTHSKIPKFTKSRPFGVPQTPFDPRTGKYLPLAEDPDILKVLVLRKVDGSNNIYVCAVVDIRNDKSGEEIKAHRFVFGTPAIDDVPEETLTFAFKVDNKWWILPGGETGPPTVDFLVDNFDRDDSDTLGSLWLNPSKWAIRDQHAFEAGTGSAGYSLFGGSLHSRAYASRNPSWITTTYIDPDAENRYIQMTRYTPDPQTILADVLYNAVLSSGDHNIRIVGNLSIWDKFLFNASTNAESNENLLYSNFFELVTQVSPEFQDSGTRISIILARSNEMTHPGDTAEMNGVYSGNCTHGGIYTCKETLPPHSQDAAQFAKIKIIANNYGSVRTVLEDFDYTEFNQVYAPDDSGDTCSGGTHSIGSMCVVERTEWVYSDGGPYGLQFGLNTYYFEIRSGYVSMRVNGQLIFSGEALYSIDAGMFGFRGGFSCLPKYIDGDGENYIEQVKVWSSDIPEPPSGESGHGKYIDGIFVYSDKYHAGDGYDPNA